MYLKVGNRSWECRPHLAKHLEVEALHLGRQWDHLRVRDRNRRGNRLFAKILRAQVVDRVTLYGYLKDFPELWRELGEIALPALLQTYARRAEEQGGAHATTS